MLGRPRDRASAARPPDGPTDPRREELSGFSFAEVCAAVERVEGVRFSDLFAALPQRAASAGDALAQVLALARAADRGHAACRPVEWAPT